MKRIQIRSEPPPEYGKKIMSFQIPSELSAKNPIIETILASLQKNGFFEQDDDPMWTRLCLDEVFVNAIKHGNKEDSSKKVEISLFMDTNQWAIRVEDEGSGFLPDDVPDVKNRESHELEHGRGILLMQNYMDEIWYYDKGRRVQLRKIRKGLLGKIKDKILKSLNLK